jgi:hypothetical protein
MKKLLSLSMALIIHSIIIAQTTEIYGDITITSIGGQTKLLISADVLKCVTLTIGSGFQSMKLNKDLKIICQNIIFQTAPVPPPAPTDFLVSGKGFTLTIETESGKTDNRVIVPEKGCYVKFIRGD